MTKYAFSTYKIVKGDKRSETRIEKSFSSWRDSLEETQELMMEYHSVIRFAPWVTHMTLEDDKGNIIRKEDCAGNNS